jgi:glucose-1-phosphate thymidylyltransferase
VYDKPMVYYPLATLMAAGIRDILMISTPRDLPNFVHLLRDGTQLGISITYVEQPRPEGLAQAFILAREFIGTEAVALILGDNIFYGGGLDDAVQTAARQTNGATVFAYRVADPERYGVVTFDSDGRAVGIEEKPSAPQSRFVVTGLYFYDNQVVDIAAALQPSDRGELEITDVNKTYLNRGELSVEILGPGTAWLDMGTPDSLLQAANFVAAVEQRQGLKIGAIEEVAYRMGFIGAEQLEKLVPSVNGNDYGKYLLGLIEEGDHGS